MPTSRAEIVFNLKALADMLGGESKRLLQEVASLLEKQTDFPVIQGHWIPYFHRGMNGTRVVSFYERINDINNESKIKAQIVFANDSYCESWLTHNLEQMRRVMQITEE